MVEEQKPNNFMKQNTIRRESSIFLPEEFDIESKKQNLTNIKFTPKLINRYTHQRTDWDDISDRIQHKFKVNKSRVNMPNISSYQSSR